MQIRTFFGIRSVLCFAISFFTLIIFASKAGVSNAASPYQTSPGILQFSTSSYSVNESGGSANITITRTNGSAGTVAVNYGVTGGTATAGSDFGMQTGVVTFGPGVTSQSFNLPIFNDAITEGNETVNLALSNPIGGATLGNTATAVLTIVDNDVQQAPAQIQLSASSYMVNEGAGSINITVTRSGGGIGTASVNYAINDGTAKGGADFDGKAGTVSFNSGMTSQTFNVPIFNDSLVEGNESATIVLSNPSGGGGGTISLGNPSSATLTIVDNDAQQQPEQIRLSASSYTVAEGAGSIDITVTRTGGTGGTASVDFEINDGTAKGGADFDGKAGTVSFNGGTQTFKIPIFDDSLVEGNETATIVLSNPRGGSGGTVTLGNPSMAVLTIVDNDVQQQQPGQIQFSASSFNVNEGGGSANITLTRTNGSDGTVAVNYSVTGATATAGSDFGMQSGVVTFGPGATSQSFSLPIIDDKTVEGNETVNLALSNPIGGASLGNPSMAVLTITDNDVQQQQPGQLQFSVSSVNVNEGGGNAGVTVTRTNGSDGAVSVNFSASGGTATVGADYNAASGTLTFGPGVTSQSFNIAIINDALVEGNETVILTLSNPTGGASLGNASTAVLTIVDDDQQSAPPTLSINNVTAPEGNSGTTSAAFIVTLSRTSNQPVTFNFATANGSATAGSDYVAASGALTIPAGSTTRSINVTVNGDVLIESDENFFVNLSNPVGAAVANGRGTAIIIDDDKGEDMLPSLSINNLKVIEGNSGTANAVFTAALSRASNQPVTFNFATSDGTATAGSDYVSASGKASIPAGSVTQSVSVAFNGDIMVEPDEIFFFDISNAAGAVIANGRGAAIIANDDGGGLPSLSIGDVRMAEGNAGTVEFVFNVSLSAASSKQVTADFAASDGTASSSGNDYEAVSGKLNFAPGTTAQTIKVTVNGDGVSEADETFFITLANASNASITKGRGTGIIVNDDQATVSATLQFSDSNYIIDESGRSFAVTVTRTGGASGRVSVNYVTSNGSAMAGSDYSVAFGTIVFEDGDMSPKTFSVPIIDDNSVEKDEGVNLTLVNPSNNARLGNPSTAVLTITDNDVSARPILQADRTVDFGAVDVNQTAVRAVSVRNGGGDGLNFSVMLDSGADLGFSIVSQPSSSSLKAGESASFNVAFSAVKSGLSVGAIVVMSNSGNALIRLLASSDITPPAVALTNPAGGETLIAGSPFVIRFSGSDNDVLAGFVATYSTDGGATFANEIGRVGPDSSQIVWNVPDALETNQGSIQVTARDGSGNTASAVSKIFTVQKPQTTNSMLQVVLVFDPPPLDQIAPPQNVVANVLSMNAEATAVGGASRNKRPIRADVDAAPTDLLGYDIYRVPRPSPDQPIPTPEQIVGDPANLIGSTSADSTTFMDGVSTDKGDNFVYSITSFFGNGQQSGGSNTAGTDLPVIKNPVFNKGTIFMDAAGSFIAASGAVLIVNDAETYSLQPDGSGSRFTVPKKSPGAPSGLKLKKLIKAGSSAKLIVKNPDGKLSVAVMFTRPK